MARGPRPSDPTVHLYLALTRFCDAEKHLRDLRAAGAHQTKEAQDLTGPDVETDVLDKPGTREPAHRKDRRSDLRLFLREESSGFGANHVTNGLGWSQFGGR